MWAGMETFEGILIERLRERKREKKKEKERDERAVVTVQVIFSSVKTRVFFIVTSSHRLGPLKTHLFTPRACSG